MSSINDLRRMFYGADDDTSVSDAELAFLQSAEAAGVSIHDLLALVGAASGLSTDDVLSSQISGDTNDRFVINADGKLEWGPGNAALDTNLYRSTVNRLRTDFFFDVGASVRASTDNTNQVGIGQYGPAGEAAIAFGNAVDTVLYRSAANTLKTDDALVVKDRLAVSAAGGLSVAAGITASLAAGATATLHVSANADSTVEAGGIHFGQSRDTNLYRSAADTLRTSDNLIVDGAINTGYNFNLTNTTGNGFIRLQEQSVEPTAAEVDAGRLFTKDNGAGKTQLCIRFNTGATQVLATEP